MSREETINKILNLIFKAFDENNYSFIVEAFNIACDFNLEHLTSDEEIYLSEDEDYVALGDDVFFFPENAF